MARPSTDPTAATPEADLLDQHTLATAPPLSDDPSPVDDPGSDAVDTPAADVLDASEADLLEQAAVLSGDGDDDYPHAYDDPSWEVWPNA